VNDCFVNVADGIGDGIETDFACMFIIRQNGVANADFGNGNTAARGLDFGISTKEYVTGKVKPLGQGL
jgi:hypothetical protein